MTTNPRVPDTLSAEQMLGGLRNNQGRRPEAEALYRESRARCRRTLGDDHPVTRIEMVNLGDNLLQQRRPDDAKPLIEEALATRRRVSGDEHRETLVALSNLGNVFEQPGTLVEAESIDREAMEKLQRVRGAEHPSTLYSRSSLARVLRLAGKPAEAEALLRETLAQRQKNPTRAGTTIAEGQFWLGQVLADQHRFAEAELQLAAAEPVLAAASRAFEAQHRQCLPSLVALYEAWNTAEPGHGHDQKGAPWRTTLASSEAAGDGR